MSIGFFEMSVGFFEIYICFFKISTGSLSLFSSRAGSQGVSDSKLSKLSLAPWRLRFKWGRLGPHGVLNGHLGVLAPRRLRTLLNLQMSYVVVCWGMWASAGF